jgi:hypothetical protein
MRYVLLFAGVACGALIVWGISGLHHALMERKRLELAAIPHSCKVVSVEPSRMTPNPRRGKQQSYTFTSGFRVYQCDEGTRTGRQ